MKLFITVVAMQIIAFLIGIGLCIYGIGWNSGHSEGRKEVQNEIFREEMKSGKPYFSKEKP